eukprot:gene10926-12087_t
MATSMDDDEDDFVTIGSAFEIPEESSSSKKPSTVHDQVAVDDKGRRRFHGAFTGGFSAGYFNTVGTKEGWTPSTFVSSRTSRENKDGSAQRPEDFMDDEDFGEYGIAPKKFMTKDKFSAQERDAASLKRNFDQAVKEGAVRSAVPGGLPVDDLIIPSKSSIGVVLLRKMGWKEGQGVGDKIKTVGLATNRDDARKIYGCSLSSSATPTEEINLDVDNLKLFLAPKDVQPISFDAKNNTHGIGYSGIDPGKAMFLGAGSLAESFKPTGAEKRGIKGQAFGVGAFEDEDDDVYSKDMMSNYDFSMASEAEIDKYANHGWSGPSKKEKQRGVIVGFSKASRPTATSKVFHAPRLPLNYIPQHTFSNTSNKPQGIQTSTNSRSASRNFLSASDRAIMLGEKEARKPIESVFDVISDEDRHRMESAKSRNSDNRLENVGSQESTKVVGGVEPEKPRKTSRWDSKVKKLIAHVPSGVEGDSFKPFASDPEKQERYNEFLATKQFGKQSELSYKGSMTEWEKEREKEEFSRAAVLFRPMSTTIASRFTRASEQSTDENEKDSSSTTAAKTDCEKAATLGMFGKLTRKTQQWHPHSVLCKRFNIPDPYPGSRIVGIPGSEKKRHWLQGFEENAYLDDRVARSETREASPIDVAAEPAEHTKSKKKSQGPLSHLNDLPDKSESVELSTSVESREESGVSAVAGKPSMDLFKAIFADSDESSDSDVEQEGRDEAAQDKHGETEKVADKESNAGIKVATITDDKSADETNLSRTSPGLGHTGTVIETDVKSYATLESDRTTKTSDGMKRIGVSSPTSNFTTTSRNCNLHMITSGERDGYERGKLDKHKHKKNKSKQKKKKAKRSSDKKGKHWKHDYSDSESTDDDDSDVEITYESRSGRDHRKKESSNHSNHESERSEKHSRYLKGEEGRSSSSRKKKSKKRKSKHKKRSSSLSDDYTAPDRGSASKRGDETQGKNVDRQEQSVIPSARLLVEKMKKHGLVVKRKSAADFM